LPSLVAIVAAALLVSRALATRPGRVGQRVGLWLAALFFTFFGPFSAVEPAWPPGAWAAAINAEGDFKDLWLAMIAMLVFSMSNIVDDLLRSYGNISRFSQFFVPIVLALYFIAIVVGIARFGSLAGKQLPDATFQTDWLIVWAASVFGVFWEVWIATEEKD